MRLVSEGLGKSMMVFHQEQGTKVCKTSAVVCALSRWLYLQEFFGVIDRYCEGDARRDFHGVDPDGFAVQVDQGSTRISECDRSIRLQVFGNVATSQPKLGSVWIMDSS